MKTLKSIFAALVIVSFASVSVSAQNTAEVTDASATALILTKIDISLTNDGLDFGTLVPTATAGTVTVPPTGARINDGNVDFIGQENEFSAAAFSVTGEVGYTFSITLPDDDTVVLDGPGADMKVTNFTASILLEGNTIVSGPNPFTVGATLSVGVNQLAGEYSGEFEVTVDYE